LTDPKQVIRELHRFITNSLREIEPGYYEYDEWQIFEDPELLSLASNALFHKIRGSGLKFDYIGALGGSGTPLAIALLLDFLRNGLKRKFAYISDPVVGVSSLWLKKVKPDLQLSGSSILLVDTEIKSGRTAWDGYQKVSILSAQVTGIAVITDYKSFQYRTDYNELVVKKGIPVVRLFDFDPFKPELIIAE
jgi:orotate phosphoribosyltransferase